MRGLVAKRLRMEAFDIEETMESKYKAIKRVFKHVDKDGNDKEVNKYQLVTEGWRRTYQNLKKDHYRRNKPW